MNRAGYAAMALGNREFFFRSSRDDQKDRGGALSGAGANLLPLHGDLGPRHALDAAGASGDETVGSSV
jgi:hypothetical protein